MAKFLQDTIEETALQRKGASGESVHDFVKFIEKVCYCTFIDVLKCASEY